MPHITDTQGILRENLLDAGCDQTQTEQIMALFSQGKEREALTLLAQHRKHLLERCHAQQKKLDCLDYLVYTVEKKKKAV